MNKAALSCDEGIGVDELNLPVQPNSRAVLKLMTNCHFQGERYVSSLSAEAKLCLLSAKSYFQ